MIGDFVKRKRNDLGLTQRELAETIDITQSYINLIELNRRKIGKKKLEDFAKALRVSRKELEKNNYIDEVQDKEDIEKGIFENKQELDTLIQKMEESLAYLKKAKELLEEE